MPKKMEPTAKPERPFKIVWGTAMIDALAPVFGLDGRQVQRLEVDADRSDVAKVTVELLVTDEQTARLAEARYAVIEIPTSIEGITPIDEAPGDDAA